MTTELTDEQCPDCGGKRTRDTLFGAAGWNCPQCGFETLAAPQAPAAPPADWSDGPLSKRAAPPVALVEAWERMDRARNILTDGNPRPECNWGMLDTSEDRKAFAALSQPAAESEAAKNERAGLCPHAWQRESCSHCKEAAAESPAAPIAWLSPDKTRIEWPGSDQPIAGWTPLYAAAPASPAPAAGRSE
jgi:hypothetical protein